MDRVAPVAEHLHLDMAGARDEFLQIEAAVAERGLRLGARLIEGGSKPSSVSATRMPRPPPPADALIITG